MTRDHDVDSLCELIASSRVGALGEYLSSGGDPDAACRRGRHRGRSLLSTAALVGNDEAVFLLLDAGADPAKTDDDSHIAPLHAALGGARGAAEDYDLIVSRLVKAGARALSGPLDLCPFVWATVRRAPRLSAVERLCALVPKELVERGGAALVRVVLGLARHRSFGDAGFVHEWKRSSTDVARVFRAAVKSGADLSAADPDSGMTPLTAAVTCCASPTLPAVIVRLGKKGALRVDENGETPFTAFAKATRNWSSTKSMVGFARKLAAAGADLTRPDRDGSSPFQITEKTKNPVLRDFLSKSIVDSMRSDALPWE